MKISVAICTWNRAALLDQTLIALKQLVVPVDHSFEIIVVNNNCTDDTKRVVASHAENLPVRQIEESEQGLSQARNRAIRESTGELFAFIDDDVLVDPDWLNAYCSAAARWPDAGYFAGAVFPWYEEQPAPHVAKVLNELANGAYLGLNLSPEERILKVEESPRGANLLIRTSAAKGLIFDPAFGRTKNQVWFGDETDFCNRIRARGFDGVWVPTAKLQHYVPRKRVHNDYLREYFNGLGTSMVRQGDVHMGTRLGNVPRWALRAYAGCFVGKYFKVLVGDKVGYFRELTKQWRYEGILREFKRVGNANDGR